MNDRFSAWKLRDLSFRGRALIANSLGLSTLWYMMSCVYTPPSIIKDINKLLFPFVWNKETEWLGRTSVIQPPAKGGLGVVDNSSKIDSLLVLWMKRFMGNNPSSWSIFFNHYLRLALDIPSNIATRSFLQKRSINSYHLEKLPPFYRNIIQAWYKLNPVTINNQFNIPKVRFYYSTF